MLSDAQMKQFALIEVDLKGPLPRTKEDYDNIVVIADPTTKYVEMHLISLRSRLNLGEGRACSRLR